ncbi:MAG: hypothetical protein KDA52_13300 [Planctomycetaceae bacterium]|nr:hypothetical protein [Planctomycetaceae bacterium]
MPIPGANDAVVPIEKVTDYLLNEDHKVGGSKAVWFIACGYQPEAPEFLIDDLLTIAKTCDEFQEISFDYGVKYIAFGSVESPTGMMCDIKTIWKLLTNETIPKFVTAYPA